MSGRKQAMMSKEREDPDSEKLLGGREPGQIPEERRKQ